MKTPELIRLFWALWFQRMISLWDAREQQKSLCVYINIPGLNTYNCCHSHGMGTYIRHVFSIRTSYRRSCDLISSPWERDEVYLSPLFTASVNQHYWCTRAHTHFYSSLNIEVVYSTASPQLKPLRSIWDSIKFNKSAYVSSLYSLR